ncbi:hypothetical protein HanXRQr2_Chr06g0241711 [Helianthus annuus]|uniref:Uncharacterized protein n=1 Tax=Helianthus annuus TaxID=4232 RepID=A0A9K3IQK1_HELAN|nr:hypothetical protein HanXRQr2_Chr06g0241711 [Helianthus annuus]KAJ0913965.1 hypothetical protein HanPSC8_Chr06g0233291 [Helianthus annuus]
MALVKNCSNVGWCCSVQLCRNMDRKTAQTWDGAAQNCCQQRLKIRVYTAQI